MLAEAWGSLRHDLALKGASREPVGRATSLSTQHGAQDAAGGRRRGQPTSASRRPAGRAAPARAGRPRSGARAATGPARPPPAVATARRQWAFATAAEVAVAERRVPTKARRATHGPSRQRAWSNRDADYSPSTHLPWGGGAATSAERARRAESSPRAAASSFMPAPAGREQSCSSRAGLRSTRALRLPDLASRSLCPSTGPIPSS
eukprot:scaffold14071_cov65-Phaeocystis_antarctica.AAC.2